MMRKEFSNNIFVLSAFCVVVLSTIGCDRSSQNVGSFSGGYPIANYRYPTPANGGVGFDPQGANRQPSYDPNVSSNGTVPPSSVSAENAYQYGYLVGGWDWKASEFSTGIGATAFDNLRNPENDPYLTTVYNGLAAGLSPEESFQLGDSYMQGWNDRWEKERETAQKKHEENLRQDMEDFKRKLKSWNFGYTL